MNKLIIGTLFVLVKAVLKIRNLPEQDRADLELARRSLDLTIKTMMIVDEVVKESRREG